MDVALGEHNSIFPIRYVVMMMIKDAIDVSHSSLSHFHKRVLKKMSCLSSQNNIENFRKKFDFVVYFKVETNDDGRLAYSTQKKSYFLVCRFCSFLKHS